MVDEAVVPFEMRLKCVRLAADCTVAQASGRPIGEVTIGGVECRVRCATYVDVAKVAEISGKNPLAGELNVVRDLPGEKFVQVAAMALLVAGSPASVEWLRGVGFGNHTALLEVVTCFLWAGPLSPPKAEAAT
jgi:hypothetical protein